MDWLVTKRWGTPRDAVVIFQISHRYKELRTTWASLNCELQLTEERNRIAGRTLKYLIGREIPAVTSRQSFRVKAWPIRNVHYVLPVFLFLLLSKVNNSTLVSFAWMIWKTWGLFTGVLYEWKSQQTRVGRGAKKYNHRRGVKMGDVQETLDEEKVARWLSVDDEQSDTPR